MKKLLLLLVGCIVSFAASAKNYSDWYVNVPYDGNGWIDNGTQPSSGIASQDLAIGTGKFAIKVWNGSASWYATSGAIEQGTWVTLENKGSEDAAKSANMTIKGATSGQTFTVEFDCATNKVRVTANGGGATTTGEYKIKGTFTGSSWPTVDLPYTHVFDGTQGQQEYGVTDKNNTFIAHNATFNGETQRLKLEGNTGNNKIAANFKGTVRFSIDGEYLVVEKVEEVVPDSYTYFLYETNGKELGQFTGNPYEFTYDITSPLAADTPLCVRRVKNDDKSDYTAFRLNSQLTYDGTNGGDKTLQENGNVITLKKALEGAVKFVLTVADNVPTSLNISGGEIKNAGNNEYTIYFYDQNNVGSEIYAHIWNTSVADPFKVWGSKDPAIKFQSTGKYIRSSAGKLFPLYSLTFSWEHKPTHVIIYNGEKTGAKKYTPDGVDVPFTDNGYYTNGSIKAETDRQPVDPGEPVTLYMHFKEDLIFEAEGGEAATPWCNILNENTYIGGLKRDDAHKMKRISEKYQIYAYTLTPDEALQGNNVEFSFKKNGSTEYSTFRANNAAKFNKARWTEFIYSTARRNNIQYAVQTYLSYPEFREIDGRGRPAVYLVGQKGGALPGLDWDPANAYEYVNKDNACFYIPVTVSAGKTAIFKISWINVKEVKANASEDYLDSARDWATYDLGLCGLAAREKYPEGSIDLSDAVRDGKEYGQDIRCTRFGVNSSLKYNNYNQYNYVVDGNKMTEGTYYIVIDTHDECRTVTLTDFDPNPSVEVTASGVEKIDLTPQQAKALHRHRDHLHCAATNGHIYMDRVNARSGSLAVHGSPGLDINNAGYDIQYTISMNGDEVLHYTGKPGRIDLKYLPAAQSNDIVCRAKYTDKDRTEKKVGDVVVRQGRKGTGLTFHSRRGEGTMTTEENFAAPDAQIIKARYAMGYAGVYGVLVDEVEMSVNTEHNVYGDIDFTIDADQTIDKRRRVQILHPAHPVGQVYGDFALNGWTPLVENWTWEENPGDEPENPNEDQYDFENGTNDWSSMMLDPDKNIPLFITRYTMISDQAELQSKTLEGKAYAIYPFIYETNPTITVVEETPASAPARAPRANDLPADMSGFALAQYPVTTDITFPLEGSDAISGVDGVLAEGEAEAEAVYYTISGIRVTGDPAPGIYLRVCGDKVEKVVVR